MADFLELLTLHGIETLVDIRAFPMSRRLPHFNRESLERELPTAGMEYHWKKALGGRRSRTRNDSPNTGLRVEAFRNYADHMLTTEFQQGITEVLALAATRRTAIMCAEAVYFRCHRMLVSDWLTANGHQVLHILDKNPPKPHRLTAEAQLIDGQLLYPGLPFEG